MVDYELLRKDLIDYLQAAYFAGGFGIAIAIISDIEFANPKELEAYAEEYGFDLDDYKA